MRYRRPPERLSGADQEAVRGPAPLAHFARTLNEDQLRKLAASDDPRGAELAEALSDVLQNSFSGEEQRWFSRIEKLRERLNASSERIQLIDYGSGPHQGVPTAQAYQGILSEDVLGDVARRRSKQFPWTVVLFEIVRQTRPSRALELGTAFGISAAFQAAAIELNGGGLLATVEGDPEQARLASNNLGDELGLDVRVVVGRFQDVFPRLLPELAPLDYVFIDGHHERDATIGYFEQLLPFLRERAVVVLDDVSWSDGMREAWGTVSTHPRVSLAVDLVALGVCVVREASARHETFRLLVAPALENGAAAAASPTAASEQVPSA
jgi:predicted O-methyltransferase YrrM